MQRSKKSVGSKSTKSTLSKAKVFSFIAVGIILLGLLGALLIWLKPNETAVTSQTTTTTPSINTNSTPVTPASLPLASASQATASAALPHSLQGTQVDGEIIINSQKQLVVTSGLRRLFDYFLSAQGEESLEAITARVTAYIQSHVPQPAAGQAITLYNQYIKYLNEVAVIDKQISASKSKMPTNANSIDLTAIKQQLQSIQALRARLFDAATIKAFFGEEEALNAYTLSVMEINQNPNLTAQAKQQMQQNAKEQYIASIADKRTQNNLREQDKIAGLLAETEKLKQQGASETELNAMRRKYVDEAAVQRLTALDKEQNDFLARVNQFKTQRDQLMKSQGDTPQTQQAIEQLQKQLFNSHEQLRLSVYLKN